jgi:hypothetical protein
MSKQPNHPADIQNGNWGTPGTNVTWDKAQGNRGKQLGPKQAPQPGGQRQQGKGQQGKGQQGKRK